MPDVKVSRAEELENEIQLAYLRSHETHMKHIYGLRWGGLILSALTIGIGAVMVFMGLGGSFNWAVEAPNSIGAKLTNASPGIVFATVGMIIVFVVILQKPVNYQTPGTSRPRKLGGRISIADIGEGASIGIGPSPPSRRSNRGTSLGGD